MSKRAKIFISVLALPFIVSFAACNSGQRSAKQPYIDASSAGKQAIAMYDKNGDGVISGDELDQAPALKEALPRLDTNGDKGVSADEVAARVNVWKGMQTALVGVRCRVILDGEPLQGAKVIFEPEPFLGDEVKTATATTNAYGDAAPTIPKKDRPDPNFPGGAHFGLYKVRISKIVNGKETIPARYNKNTVLGQEVAYDDPVFANHDMQFVLTSKP